LQSLKDAAFAAFFIARSQNAYDLTQAKIPLMADNAAALHFQEYVWKTQNGVGQTA